MKSSILFGNVHYAAVDSNSTLLINKNIEKSDCIAYFMTQFYDAFKITSELFNRFD